MNSILIPLRKELQSNSDEKLKESSKRFFKEKIKVYGMKTSLCSQISKKYYSEVKDKTKKEIFELCEELFKSGYMEESFIACNWSYNVHKQFEEKDIFVFEKWIENYVTNWATCDTLCNHTIGEFMEMYPKQVSILKKWAKSKNMWMRRAAAVSLIVPAKRGLFFKEALEIADILMMDKEDLVQKGYGWLLKEESRTKQKDIFNYVIKNKKVMPRTALRYAIEKMPQELRKKAMVKE
ncbi:MAG: DNA alkylation repair protein [Candidatus Micrarchaeia archaeon]|jgi:3-methyladenine DNA glycosylase AlkD